MTVISRLNGGLGNQLFQVAMGLAVAKASGSPLFLDPKGLACSSRRGKATHRDLEVDNLGWKLWPQTEQHQLAWWLPIARLEGCSRISSALAMAVHGINGSTGRRTSYIRESMALLDPTSLVSKLRSQDLVYLSGYWADKSIPNMVREELRRSILSLVPTSSRLLDLQVEMTEAKSIAVHVRRGDFFTKIAAKHGVLDVDYFFRGVEVLRKNGEKVYLFSDDPEWCRTTFGRLGVERFIGQELRESPIDHLLLMSKAKKFVLSNSSFSWWSAWLSDIDGTNIIRPDLWVIGGETQAAKVYPSEWSTLGDKR